MPNNNIFELSGDLKHYTDNMADRREKMRLRLQEKLRKKHAIKAAINRTAAALSAVTDGDGDICPKCGGTVWEQAILLDDETRTAKAIDDAACKSCKWLRKTDFDCPADDLVYGVISVCVGSDTVVSQETDYYSSSQSCDSSIQKHKN